MCVLFLAELKNFERMQQRLILIWHGNSLACPHVFRSALWCRPVRTDSSAEQKAIGLLG